MSLNQHSAINIINVYEMMMCMVL